VQGEVNRAQYGGTYRLWLRPNHRAAAVVPSASGQYEQSPPAIVCPTLVPMPQTMRLIDHPYQGTAGSSEHTAGFPATAYTRVTAVVAKTKITGPRGDLHRAAPWVWRRLHRKGHAVQYHATLAGPCPACDDGYLCRCGGENCRIGGTPLGLTQHNVMGGILTPEV
jgi:hypothetical protein